MIPKPIIQEYLDQESFKEDVEKADRRFEFKSFAVRFRWLKRLSSFISGAMPIPSIFTGGIWLAGLMAELVWPFVAWPAAFALAVAWEYGKAKAITSATELAYIRGYQLSIFTGCFALALQAGSTFASLEGVREVHAKSDGRIEAARDAGRAEADSLRKAWDARIAEAKGEAKSYREANMIRDIGGKDVLRSGATKAYALLSAGIKEQEARRDSAEAELRRKHASEEAEAERESGFRTDVVVGIALAVEALILLANWFLVHYDYEAKKLKYMLTKGDSIYDDYKTFAEVYAMHTLMPKAMQALPQALGRSPMGFRPNAHGQGGGGHGPSDMASHLQALSKGLDAKAVQELARNFQEIFGHGQAHANGHGASDANGMGAIERAIQAGLLDELRQLRAAGRKPAYQVLTAKYGISIPQLTQTMELHRIKF